MLTLDLASPGSLLIIIAIQVGAAATWIGGDQIFASGTREITVDRTRLPDAFVSPIALGPDGRLLPPGSPGGRPTTSPTLSPTPRHAFCVHRVPAGDDVRTCSLHGRSGLERSSVVAARDAGYTGAHQRDASLSASVQREHVHNDCQPANIMTTLVSGGDRLLRRGSRLYGSGEG